MIAKLEFNLPEERSEYEMYYQAPKMHSALLGIDNYCRSQIKHNSNLTESAIFELETIRNIIREEGIEL